MISCFLFKIQENETEMSTRAGHAKAFESVLTLREVGRRGAKNLPALLATVDPTSIIPLIDRDETASWVLIKTPDSNQFWSSFNLKHIL